MYQNFKWKGVQIPYTATEINTSHWRANIDVNGLVSETKQFNRAGSFGIKTTPTVPRGRVINIQGQIIGVNDVDRCTALMEIEQLFNPVCNTCEDNEFFMLEFQDWCGREWFLNAKVFQFLKMPIKFGCNPVINFSVQLIAEEPFIFSKTTNINNLNFSLFGGEFFPNNLDIPLCKLSNYTDITNSGTFCSPTVFTITGEIKNPRVYIGHKFFGLNLDLSANQTLIIDSQNLTVTINGSNVLGARMPNSVWLNLDVGLNQVGYTGDNYNWDAVHPSTAIISYNDTRI